MEELHQVKWVRQLAWQPYVGGGQVRNRPLRRPTRVLDREEEWWSEWMDRPQGTCLWPKDLPGEAGEMDRWAFRWKQK